MKIAILDDGVDQRHPFFDPAGLTMPPGFPKGDVAFTSAKVIVARAFAPRDAGWPHAGTPFDPVHSFHGMHVAGIAAGAPDTPVGAGDAGASTSISGVAPLAYIGNYKVADGADGVRPRPQRQLSGARRRDRGSRRRRDGRAQPLARRARGRAEPRCGGDRARQRRSCGRDPGRLGRKRLRLARARQRRLAGILGARDHRRRRRRRPDPWRASRRAGRRRSASRSSRTSPRRASTCCPPSPAAVSEPCPERAWRHPT